MRRIYFSLVLSVEVPENPLTTAAVDPDYFREVMGMIPTAVAVITAFDEEAVGVAVGSFVSISLEPPLVGFFIGRDSSTWPRIASSGKFVANVLSQRQAELCRQFGVKGADRFAGAPWSSGHGGAPRLHDALAWIECDIERVERIGDHDLVVGAVRSLVGHEDKASDHGPLVFFQRGYRTLTPAESDAESSVPGEVSVTRAVTTTLPTAFGDFEAIGYLDDAAREHMALRKGDPAKAAEPVPVFVTGECRAGHVFHSSSCDCGARLDAALEVIERAGVGAVLYMTGVGGVNAHSEHRSEAELARAACILAELGAVSLRLLVSDPELESVLRDRGVEVGDPFSHP